MDFVKKVSFGNIWVFLRLTCWVHSLGRLMLFCGGPGGAQAHTHKKQTRTSGLRGRTLAAASAIRVTQVQVGKVGKVVQAAATPLECSSSIPNEPALAASTRINWKKYSSLALQP